jgi:cysteinyl-tRNA synthetase
LTEFEEFINDDFNTAKVLASMFELVPIINSIKDKHILPSTLTKETLELLQQKMKVFVEDIFGLKSELQEDNGKLDGVLQVLIDLRKQARSRKDFATSDAIRNQLLQLGIALKDEKDGNMSYTFQ